VVLIFRVGQWNQIGIWIISRSDDDYPNRIKEHLGSKAPPVFFCAGNRSLLEGGGLAIIGSRNVDAEGEEFARHAASKCASEYMPVVSGGARGVDQIAMKSALDAGGHVIGVLAENLSKQVLARDVRTAIADDQILLMTPYNPKSHFTIGNAMGRNKLIYAMADYGLVISTDFNSGGTWSGAKEELKRKNARHVFVRIEGSPPPGNKKLLEIGAIGFPSMNEDTDMKLALKQVSENTQKSVEPEEQLSLFSSGMEGKPSVRELATESILDTTKANKNEASGQKEIPESIYDAVLPVIKSKLNEAMNIEELTAALNVAKPQLNKWLKKAVSEGHIEKLKKPVRYKRK